MRDVGQRYEISGSVGAVWVYSLGLIIAFGVVDACIIFWLVLILHN